MKTIGLLGGLTWHSTETYYRRINEGVMARLGPFRSADLALRSIDYGVVRRARETGDWKPVHKAVVGAARDLKRAGADGLFICSNTMHRLAGRIDAEVGLPVLHIADALAEAAEKEGLTHLALFGTRFTMTQPFYKDRLAKRGIKVSIPHDADEIGRIVLEQLAQGDVREASRQFFLQQLEPLIGAGAQAMVLGCTEIGLLIGPEQVSLPVLDTALLHADAAVDWALSD